MVKNTIKKISPQLGYWDYITNQVQSKVVQIIHGQIIHYSAYILLDKRLKPLIHGMIKF